jgi:hypothetical protein
MKVKTPREDMKKKDVVYEVPCMECDTIATYRQIETCTNELWSTRLLSEERMTRME